MRAEELHCNGAELGTESLEKPTALITDSSAVTSSASNAEGSVILMVPHHENVAEVPTQRQANKDWNELLFLVDVGLVDGLVVKAMQKRDHRAEWRWRKRCSDDNQQNGSGPWSGRSMRATRLREALQFFGWQREGLGRYATTTGVIDFNFEGVASCDEARLARAPRKKRRGKFAMSPP